jgi:pyruvate/oxaloacetate carboxyltransferase
MGADSLCVKDMAGLMAPYDTYRLIKALKETVQVPVQLHSHYTSGMAGMTYLQAIEAGVDIIDTAVAPLALRTSLPAVEPIVLALEGTDRDTGIDLRHLFTLDEYFESILPKYREFMDTTRLAAIDTGVLRHQVPGGMISNLVNQLREQKALHRIDDVYAELPRARADLGYPPLVTPTSQIVGVQAVLNVLAGRYNMIANQTRDYVYGLYGKPPVPIKEDVQQKILRGYSRGEDPISCRPADALKPELDKAKEEAQEFARDMYDLLIYVLYPHTGKQFLRWKYGLDRIPEKLKSMAKKDVQREDEASARDNRESGKEQPKG